MEEQWVWGRKAVERGHGGMEGGQTVGGGGEGGEAPVRMYHMREEFFSWKLSSHMQ